MVVLQILEMVAFQILSMVVLQNIEMISLAIHEKNPHNLNIKNQEEHQILFSFDFS